MTRHKQSGFSLQFLFQNQVKPGARLIFSLSIKNKERRKEEAAGKARKEDTGNEFCLSSVLLQRITNSF